MSAARQSLAGLALFAALAISLAGAPARIAVWARQDWPIIRLWPDLDAQYRLQLGEVPYSALVRADALLPPDAGVLLVTPGLDVRHLDYTTFHRALYFLAPRPVWWLTSAPPDGTWESRWWISKPLTGEQILATAAAKGVYCVLLVNVPQVSLPGQITQLDGARLVTVAGGAPCLASGSGAASLQSVRSAEVDGRFADWMLNPRTNGLQYWLTVGPGKGANSRPFSPAITEHPLRPTLAEKEAGC